MHLVTRKPSQVIGISNPSARIEADRIDDERIAFPMANGIPIPLRIHILRMGTPVRGYVPPSCIAFGKQGQLMHVLNELDCIARSDEIAQSPARHALQIGY